MNELGEFLSRNSIKQATPLPWVHTSRAFHLRNFKETNSILTTDCDTFVGEKLNYFFMGRPAYKYIDDGAEGEYWELPCCFIFDFSAISGARRIFPFDSGAFARKIFPSYLKMMDLRSFEVAAISDAPHKLIGAFFGSARNYFKLIGRSKEEFVKDFTLGVMDAEMKALHRLSAEKAPTGFDDRRFTIEIQSDTTLELKTNRPLAVIAPSEYYEEAAFRKHVTKEWGATPISYSTGPLSVANSYGQIYSKIFEFYLRRGFL